MSWIFNHAVENLCNWYNFDVLTLWGLGVVTFQSDIFDRVIFEGFAFGCSEKCFSDPISIFPVNLTDDALKKNVFSEAL